MPAPVSNRAGCVRVSLCETMSAPHISLALHGSCLINKKRNTHDGDDIADRLLGSCFGPKAQVPSLASQALTAAAAADDRCLVSLFVTPLEGLLVTSTVQMAESDGMFVQWVKAVSQELMKNERTSAAGQQGWYSSWVASPAAHVWLR